MNSFKFNRKLLGWSLVILAALAGLVWLLTASSRSVPSGKWDTFAQCLAGKGLTMYGADWCPHCQNEKKWLGDSFKYLPYVECTTQTATCQAKGVQGYPTFIFDDGRRLVGEQTLQQLSGAAGCPLNADK